MRTSRGTSDPVFCGYDIIKVRNTGPKEDFDGNELHGVGIIVDTE